MRKTIAQRYRPKTIKEVAGQELAKAQLLAITKKPENAPRVIVLSGSYGLGKSSLARAFVRALNCPNKDTLEGDACGCCETCSRELDSVPWYEEYDSSLVGTKDSINEIKQYFDYNSDNGYKVITIDEAHLLSKQAQSALLKVFEEISSNVFVILCTTDKEKLLDTIISRSYEVTLNLLSHDEMRDNLLYIAESENIEIPTDDLELIINRARGHVRDAHMLLDKYILLNKEDFKEVIKSARELFILFLLACYENKIESVRTAIIRLLQFPLVDLKIDYESLILEIMRVYTKFEEPRDKLIGALNNKLKSEALNLYYILNDPIIYNSFDSDNKFQSACYVIYLKINNRVR